ncbi:archaeosortase A [Natronomonas sp. EA1]|uniref:archaeosortase A n=1 Tax=Natronomonas sp. EA1 TaxID=3421655 RepID=UPI003EB6F1D2
MPQGPTDLLAWASVLAFVVGALVERYDARTGRTLTAGAWAVFAVFWLALVPHFAFEQRSIIEGVLSAVAVPASLYTGYLLYRGRDTLMVLSRGVAVMGLIYLPATTLAVLYEPLIETTTVQIVWAVERLGYDPQLVTGPEGLESRILFETNGHLYAQDILLACTGLGSATIFIGLIAAVRAPLSRKLQALAVSVPVIWALNLVRNVFIALGQGKQWFTADWMATVVYALFGNVDPRTVSFYVADRIIAQSASVVALVAILFAVLRYLPELKVVVQDVLFLLTRQEHDLGEGREPPRGGMRADGGARVEDGRRD